VHVLPFSPERATELVTALLAGEQLPISDPGLLARAIVDATGSGVPYHLQLVLQSCLSRARTHGRLVSPADVAPALHEDVLGSTGRGRFVHLVSRLRAGLGADEPAARVILRVLADGSRPGTLLAQALATAGLDPATLPRVLLALEAEYLTTRDGEEIRFFDDFVRKWWRRNGP
jgi:DNA-binding transcriptional ArsR family regulator